MTLFGPGLGEPLGIGLDWWQLELRVAQASVLRHRVTSSPRWRRVQTHIERLRFGDVQFYLA
ncbi:hypothetical protein BD310DRAFT_952594 [Dichomitus squalens]|uniref:Uncharacterized protein n=2 Tax=Dichomitus squalens TaxID=114155 RepID=A0A4Q9PH02_9APHY|nr:hypothetical protein BD310DRAFT_952594 [Dichomitus squalens]